MKNSFMLETEKWLKRSLKGKVSINEKTTITFLMMGFMGLVQNGFSITASSGTVVHDSTGLAISNATASGGVNSVAIGGSMLTGANASGRNTIAIGGNSNAVASNTIAIGLNTSVVGLSGSIVIGNSTTLRANNNQNRASIVIGDRAKIDGSLKNQNGQHSVVIEQMQLGVDYMTGIIR